MSNKSKGVLPDGAKIRKLRKQVGKTQKGLINNTVVMLRTLQRAEQGKPILAFPFEELSFLLSMFWNPQEDSR